MREPNYPAGVGGTRGTIIKAAAVIAVVWAVVFAIRSFAADKRITAESMGREVREAGFEDWSENPGSPAMAERRERKLRELAGMYNRLDFTERQKDRDSRSGEVFFKKLSRNEKELFIELTVVESMSRFMEALDQMPPDDRKRFVEKGLKEIREGRTEEEIRRAEDMDGNLLAKISEEGMRAYFDKASADTKMDLAPLMEAINEVMQGLRGNQFGGR